MLSLRGMVTLTRVFEFIMLSLALVVVAGALQFLPPAAIDWHEVYKPAALTLANGGNPYDVAKFYNPPWVLLPLVPLVALPDPLGRGLVFVAGLACYAVALRRMGAGIVSTVAFLLSPFVVHDMLDGNINGLVLLGLTLTPAAGLFLVLLKPQMGIVVALVWFVRSWRERGLLDAVRVVAPVSAAFAASFVAFGFWPAKIGVLASMGFHYEANTSLFPASLIPGVVLAALSLTRYGTPEQRDRVAFAAGPMLSPHVTFYSWVALPVPLVRNRWAMVVAVVAAWAVVALGSGG